MSGELFRLEGVEYEDWVKFDDFSIEKGNPVCIMGDSGCGKSTLLKLMNNTLSPTRGSIYYEGKETTGYDPVELRKKVCLVRQEAFLFDDDIRGNFREFYGFRNLPCPEDESIRKIMKVCGLDFSLDKDCTTMSGGERQRIFLSVFLSLGPSVLLLDEPTSALDENTENYVMKNILEFCAGNNIQLIFITHNKILMNKFASRSIIFHGGANERDCKIKHSEL